MAGHIVDLYCVRLSNAASFCENYVKLYFDAKHLEKGLNRGGGEVKFLGHFFDKKVPFLEYALHGGVMLLVKLQALACSFTKCITSPWVFFTFFKLYECYQIAQRSITHNFEIII